jgi:uncharacterized protein (DUF2062 family)
MGVTVGMFIGMTPTVGIQMLLVVIVAALTSPFFRFNRLSALLTVYITNPITTVPIYYFNYKVGTLFVKGNLTRQDFERILEPRGLAELWDGVVALFVEIGTPLVVGSLVVATICSAISYPAIRGALHIVRRDADRQGAPPDAGASGGLAA